MLMQSTINAVAADARQWPVFVKPVHDAKKFAGVLVRGVRYLVGCGDQHEDTPVAIARAAPETSQTGQLRRHRCAW
jgi:hypothetical protein